MNLKNDIQGIITDLDGTLIHNQEANIQAYKQAFEAVGLPFDQQQYVQHFGLRFFELMHELAPASTPEQQKQIHEKKSVYYQKNVHAITVNTALVNFLRSMKGSIPIGLSTTASQRNAEFVLNHFGLLSLFDAVVYGDQVAHGKPDPECYRMCMQLLNVEPERVLVFEDSDIGIHAAQAAGAHTIRIYPSSFM